MFGGETTWDASTDSLSWTHAIDLHTDSDVDIGRVEWRDGDLIEYGTAPGPAGMVHYHEVWRRQQVGEPVIVADRVGGVGRLARCGVRGAVFIDARPTVTPAGGLFAEQSWQCVFDVTISRRLHSKPVSVPTAIGASFDQFENSWTVVDRWLP